MKSGITPAQRAARQRSMLIARRASVARLEAERRIVGPALAAAAERAVGETATQARERYLAKLAELVAAKTCGLVRIDHADAFDLAERGLITFDSLLRCLSGSNWRVGLPRRDRAGVANKAAEWVGWLRLGNDRRSTIYWGDTKQRRLLGLAARDLGVRLTDFVEERVYFDSADNAHDERPHRARWRRVSTQIDVVRDGAVRGKYGGVLVPGVPRFAASLVDARQYISVMAAEGVTTWFVMEDILVPQDSDWADRLEEALTAWCVGRPERSADSTPSRRERRAQA